MISTRKRGLANIYALFMRAQSDRKGTTGITESCRVRVHRPFLSLRRKKMYVLKVFIENILKAVQIDIGACFFDVGFAYPGYAQVPKGVGVH